MKVGITIGQWLVAVMGSAVAMLAAPAGLEAQNVLTKQAWTYSALPPHYAYTANSSQTRTPYPAPSMGLGNQMLRLQGSGSATQESYVFSPDSSLFYATNQGTQSFTLTQQSVVQIPLYLIGNITYFGGSNDSSGGVTGVTQIRNSSGTVVFNNTSTFGTQAANGNKAINRYAVGTVTLLRGTYTFREALQVRGKTAVHDTGSSGSGVTTNFSSTSPLFYQGLTSLVGAYPTGLPGTRAFVQAPQARADYGVTGTGVTVGQIEPGRPYIATDPVKPNAALYVGGNTANAYRVALTNTPSANNTNYRDEHSEEVASIIAGADANSENAGVAPGASILSASMSSYTGAANKFRAGMADLFAAHVTVVNESAGGPTNDPNNDAAWLDQQIDAPGNSNVLFVKSVGNNGTMSTSPGMNYNGMAVGALNSALTTVAGFSSSGTSITQMNPLVPELVAPGTYVNAAVALGGFSKTSTGETFDTPSGPDTGAITGTSFAAPFVSGTAALIDNYYNNHKVAHDIDHRVLKAVLMNSATTAGLFEKNGTTPWTQGTAAGTGTLAGALLVYRSLDPQLGAGAVNADAAIAQYVPNEISGATGNAMQHLVNRGSYYKHVWWDDATVQPAQMGVGGAINPGSVDYMLGWVAGAAKITLDWDAISDGTDADEIVPNLSLRIYQEGNNAGNTLGLSMGDKLIAATTYSFTRNGNTVYSNVGLLTLNLPAFNGIGTFPNPNAGQYFVDVQNLGLAGTPTGVAVQFGIAAITPTPEPTTLGLLAVAMLATTGRRRRAA